MPVIRLLNIEFRLTDEAASAVKNLLAEYPETPQPPFIQDGGTSEQWDKYHESNNKRWEWIADVVVPLAWSRNKAPIERVCKHCDSPEHEGTTVVWKECINCRRI